MSYQKPNRNLISASVDRRQLETNIFHMFFGEITITLDDVYYLIDLLVIGLPVQRPDRNEEHATNLIRRLLGVSSDEADDALHGARGHFVRLEWLCDTFRHHMTSDNAGPTHCTARAFCYTSWAALLSGRK